MEKLLDCAMKIQPHTQYLWYCSDGGRGNKLHDESVRTFKFKIKQSINQNKYQ